MQLLNCAYEIVMQIKWHKTAHGIIRSEKSGYKVVCMIFLNLANKKTLVENIQKYL